MVVIAQLAEHRIVVPSVVGSNPTLHPQTSFEMSFFCIVACSLRHSLSVIPSVSVSKLPIRLHYPINPNGLASIQKKSGGGEGSLGQVLARCTRCDLRSALYEPHSPPKRESRNGSLFWVERGHLAHDRGFSAAALCRLL